MSNRRIFFACKSVGVSKDGLNTFTGIHGLQSFSSSAKFTLEQVFEIGQLAIYDNAETTPDVEVTLEKCLDGYPLIYHLCTNGAVSGSLTGRSNIRSTIGWSVFADTSNSASGTALAQCTVSGVFPSSLAYKLQVNGPFTESVTLVGNNRVWTNAFTAPVFDNTDSPLAGTASGVVNRRQDLILGESATTATRLPQDIPGVSASGYVPYDTVLGQFNAHIQSIQVQANLGRDQLFELGRRGPYHRPVNFPVEVKVDVEVLSTTGDGVQALENSTNLVNRTVFIRCKEGTTIDCGSKCKLQSVAQGGGNAGANGGNDTTTFSLITYNDLIIGHPQDPSGL